MPVIDVDCHFEVALTAETHPLRAFAARFPNRDVYIRDAIAGPLFHATPTADRPRAAEFARFLPDANVSAFADAVRPGEEPPQFVSTTPAERLAWFDRVGIDHALINPGLYWPLAGYMDAQRPDAVRLLNDFVADALDGHTDRLMPVSMIDFTDLDAAVVELERMRARGSRAFWIRAEPVHGVSPAHPDWDRLWGAATALGMVAILHIGNSPGRFDGGWANAGWMHRDGTGTSGFYTYANAMNHHSAEMLLGGMIYGGVFGRHPTLTVITEELNLAWLPWFVARCDLARHPWRFDLTPGEMARRNIRNTPLAGLGDQRIGEVLRALPDMIVFSSDYPHGEGNADPINLLAPQLEGIDDELRTAFMGDNIAECFARMGDPIT